jgi:F-type H+-transporting ATPase subunit gamma
MAIIGRALEGVTAVRGPDLGPADGSNAPGTTARAIVIALCTEQGFVGAFNEHVLRVAAADGEPRELLVVGARGREGARERGTTATFAGPMTTHLPGLGAVADRISEAVLPRVNAGGVDRVEIVHARRTPGGGSDVIRRRLLPVELSAATDVGTIPPITMLPLPQLRVQLIAEYFYAQVFEAIVESFAAENAARLAVLQAANVHLGDMLTDLRRTENVLRQDEITAEVLELIGGRMGAPAS